ncbi:hypothetical protein B0T25DRAFT_567056 [Lasiosphaeria hispida]|uniref:Uncharacterized protein n=1 Tax=Lasiosphaeria hispida TaxID=260671 RepID=A0AAJ0MGK7_9PEZI|nr:hypothetical protein B0T25DRAFT_567056 [Lasiosphaeria hispida]
MSPRGEGPMELLIPHRDVGGFTPEWGVRDVRFSAKTCAEDISKLPDYCYAFLSIDDYPPEVKDREALLAHFGVPAFVANRTCFEVNGFFGYKPTFNDEEVFTSCTTWFRCLFKMIRKVGDDPSEDGLEYVKAGKKDYRWYEMTVFSCWESKKKCQVLCVDAPFDIRDELQNALMKRTDPLNFNDPLAMHADLWDRMVVYYDIAVWRVRDPVRKLEKSRTASRDVFKPTHEHTRHAIHMSEVLESAVCTAMEMQRCRSEIYNSLPKKQLGYSYVLQANEYAAFHVSLVRNLKLRSDSNQARLADEINFAFNNLTRQDSNLIKSITLLTMFFLPSTFVSAIFSTTFFNYGDTKWEVSGQLWIYWATIIPVTIFVILIWYVWLPIGDRTAVSWKELSGQFRDFSRRTTGHLMNRGKERGSPKDAENAKS